MAKQLISFSTIGTAHNAPRFWIEGGRLSSLGFAPGTPIHIEAAPRQLTITPAILSDRLVSYRTAAGCNRPIIDLNSHRLLAGLAEYGELKVIGSDSRLLITPSIRAFSILRARRHTGPFRVFDVFAGGGTLSDAFAGNPDFQVIGALELEPAYADEYCRKHPDADVIVGDIRKISPDELPECDIIAAGIPCTSHSNQGRAKNGLAGRPELGDAGDLYIHILSLIAAKMPAGVILENVPNFRNSLAGLTVMANLRRLGYSVDEHIIEPNAQWAEPTTRNRWVCIATLRQGFELSIPNTPHTAAISEYLDAPDPARDQADAERIATTIAGLRRHNERHAALGHGFEIQVLDGRETAAPVICKSYHKINSSGFFVQTPYGPRLLRQGEIARLHGQNVLTDHYATAVAMMGQGVLTRVFRQIVQQLGAFLASREAAQTGAVA